MSGKGERIFDPEGYLTRAEAATMIVNACGWNLDTIQYRENSDYMPLFADVVDAWYTPYVHVAYVHNVVSGTGDSSGYGFEWKYEPEQPVSRAQLVVMLDGTLTQEQAAQEYYACTYDTETNIRTEKGYLYGSEVLFDILEYESNEKEQLVRFTDYNAKGGVENNVDYLYDSEGRLQKEIYTNADGECYKKIEYDYAPEWGDVQMNMTYPLENNRVVRDVWHLDEKGRVKGYCGLTEEGAIAGSGYFEYVEDEQGRLLEKWNGALGRTSSCVRCTYNEEGLVIQEAKYNYERMKKWTIYEYDEAGNVAGYVNYFYEGK